MLNDQNFLALPRTEKVSPYHATGTSLVHLNYSYCNNKRYIAFCIAVY